MSIQVIGSGGVVADVDGSTYNALKIVKRPVEYGLFGQYRISVSTGTINPTLTNASVFQFYWSSSQAVALIWGVSIDYGGNSNNAGFHHSELFVARQVTAFGSGGTAISVPGTTSDGQKLRTTMRPSLVPLVRISAGTALTAGTWTQDAQPVGCFTHSVDNANVNENRALGVKLYGIMEHRMAAPIVLAQNEALNIQKTTATIPQFQAAFNIAWSEVASY